jgi:zinc protease
MDQAKLDLQRDVVKNERRQGVDNVPYGRANETILAALFPAEHPYHHSVIGSMDDLSAASLDDVKRFFNTYYAPNNATLVIAGDFDTDSARTWVARYFGRIPRNPETPPRPTVPSFEIPRDTFMVLEDRVQLPRLYQSWHTVKAFADDDAALDVLAFVLADGKNSRLYKRLVYDLQVAQDVRAFQASMRLDGYFQVVVTPKPGQTPSRMASLVREEIDRISTSGIEPRELERARNSILANQIDRRASVLGKSDRLNYYNYFVGTPDYTRQDAERFRRVTVADVQRAARTYLKAPSVVLTVVPEGKTEMMVTAAGGER